MERNTEHIVEETKPKTFPFSFFHTVPPSVPVIYNEQNEPIESRAGPYEESGQLILNCVVLGGKI